VARPSEAPLSPSDADLLALDDEALATLVAGALADEARRAGAALPDPRTVLDDARRLLAHWDAQLYGACCTDDPAWDDLRADIGDIAKVADVLLVDALTTAIADASGLSRTVTRLIAAFVVKHGFQAGRGLACGAWGRVAGQPPGPAASLSP